MAVRGAGVLVSGLLFAVTCKVDEGGYTFGTGGGAGVAGSDRTSGAAGARDGSSGGRSGGSNGGGGATQSGGGGVSSGGRETGGKSSAPGGTTDPGDGGETSTDRGGAGGAGGSDEPPPPECEDSGPRRCDDKTVLECHNGFWAEIANCDGECEGEGMCVGGCDAVTCTATACKLPGTCNPSDSTCSTPTNAPNGDDCDDGNLCTQTDSCQSGACVGDDPVMCPEAAECKVRGVCNPSTGVCSAPSNAPNGFECDDEDPCTDGDSCQSGQCAGTQIVCNNPPACKVAVACDDGDCNYTVNAQDGPDSKCGSSSPYCYQGNCVRCLQDNQCTTNQPSCHPTSHTCVCRRPSSANKLTNPNFDGNMNGWTAFSAVLNTEDADICSQSNSVYTENGENDPYQCVQMSSGTHYLRGKFKGADTGNFIRVRFYAVDNCGNDPNTSTWDMPLSGITGTWTLYSGSFVAPSGTKSARINIWGLGLYSDQMYVGTSSVDF